MVVLVALLYEVPLPRFPAAVRDVRGVSHDDVGPWAVRVTISATQQQAMMTASFFFLIPMVFLSGFVFPIENMPAVIQPVTYLIPLRYFLVILRGIFLKVLVSKSSGPTLLASAGVWRFRRRCDRANDLRSTWNLGSRCVSKTM